MKKKIGIVGWSTGKSSFGATKEYLQYLSGFGQVEIIMPSKSVREDIDLVVLPGGWDINPYLFDEVPGFMNTNPSLYKEFFYMNNLKDYINAGKSIYGICLGFQQLCVYFGSKLTQHLPSTGIHNVYSKPYEDLVHSVDINIEKLSLKKTQKVNSLHHQGVMLNDLSGELIPIATDSSEGSTLVEGIMHKSLPIAAVQWHPEHIYDELSGILIKELLK